jgi:hypothetical protein
MRHREHYEQNLAEIEGKVTECKNRISYEETFLLLLQEKRALIVEKIEAIKRMERHHCEECREQLETK